MSVIDSKIYKSISLSELLEGQPFLLLKDKQLLYKKEEEYVITTISPTQNYTASDYANLPEGAPYELINGKLTYMPSPKLIHQAIAGNIYRFLSNYVFKKQLGKVFFAPLDVHFDEQNVYQPDVIYVSLERMGILKDFVKGAPDLVIEILSKGTAKADKVLKKAVYGKYGVQEYWIVYPNEEMIEVFDNQENTFILDAVFTKEDILISKVVKGFEVALKNIF